MKHNAYLTLLAIFLLFSCGKKEVESKSKIKEESNILTSNLEFEVKKKRKVELNKAQSNYEDFKKNINSFEVSVRSLNTKLPGAKISCSKDRLDQDERLIEALFDDEGINAHLTLKLNDKDKFDTDFICSVVDKDVQVGEFKINTKKSVIVSGKQNAQDLNLGLAPIEKLVIEEGATLITNGTNILLEMDELISFGGEISTFDEEKTYTPVNDRDGLGGGKIILKTKTSQGKVIINLIGLQAGLQTKIPEPIFEIPLAHKNNNGKCSGARDINSDYKKDQKCFGKKGAKGIKGKKGYPGYNGGPSGSIYFSHEKMSNLKIQINYKSGKGNLGGKGGIGGKGGPGGIGSTIMLTEYVEPQRCPMCSPKFNREIRTYKYPDGTIGDQGDQGEEGDHGSFGQREESILEFKDQDIKIPIDTYFRNF